MNRFNPLGKFPILIELCGGWQSTETTKIKQTYHMANLNKTPRRNLSDSDTELESRTEFLSIMRSLEEKSLANS